MAAGYSRPLMTDEFGNGIRRPGGELAQSSWKRREGLAGVTIDTTGEFAITIARDAKGTVFRFRTDNLQLVSQFEVGPGHRFLSADASRVLAWPGDATNHHPTIYLWDSVAGNLLMELPAAGASGVAFHKTGCLWNDLSHLAL